MGPVLTNVVWLGLWDHFRDLDSSLSVFIMM